MDVKKKHNSNNIIAWIATFILLALAIANVFNYIDLKNPTIQETAVFIAETAVFIAEILITVIFMVIMFLDVIQQELYDIKNSLDDLYDLKQVDGVCSTINKRHLEKALHDIYRQHMEKTINDTYNRGKINEESKN